MQFPYLHIYIIIFIVMKNKKTQIYFESILKNCKFQKNFKIDFLSI